MAKNNMKTTCNSARLTSGSAEVMDPEDRPLMVMPLTEIHRQLLPHRSVAVLVYSQEGKLYLQKRSRGKRHFPGRWDISASGHVEPGQAARDTALAELSRKLNIKAEQLRFVRLLPASPGTGFEFTSIFALERVHWQPEPNQDEVEEGFFYSAEEIRYLIREFRELLTPRLVHLWETGLPFPTWGAV